MLTVLRILPITSVEMAELSRLRKSRSANRNVLKGFIVKAKNATQDEYTEENRVNIKAILKTMESKRKVVAGLDEKIMDLLEEDAIDEDVDTTSNFELELDKDVALIVDYLDKKAEAVAKALVAEIRAPTAFPGSERTSVSANASVKLPKISIKKFYGDPTAWQQFHEMFDATVHKN